MELKIIEFLITSSIIYILVIFIMKRYMKIKTINSVKILQSIMMTFGATSFIYSYKQFVKSKDEKFQSIAKDFPQKWKEIIYLLHEDSSISYGIKEWIITGKVNEQIFSNLSIADLSIIEFLMASIYEVWLAMLSIELVTLKSSVKDYEKLFNSSENNSEQLTTHLNKLVGLLFKEEYVFNRVLTEKKYYPNGFINYINYCVRSLRVDS